MVLTQFLNCLSYFGVNTGASNALEGVYNFQSGDPNIVYNLLYPTGQNYISNVINSTTLPLITLGLSNSSGNFSGDSLVHLGYRNSNNFEMLMDISYPGCAKLQTAGVDYVLLSTVQNTSEYASGFILGINDSNRLYFQTSGLQYTLGFELKPRNWVFASLANNQFVNFGVYDIYSNTLNFETVDVGAPILQTTDLYFGGFLNNTNPAYTGFNGTINQIIAFQGAISPSDVETCVNCSFATGTTTSITTNPISAIQVTGGVISGTNTSVITGYQNATGQLQTISGTYVNVIYPSGVSTNTVTNQVLYPLYNQTTVNLSGQTVSFAYDTVSLSNFTNSELYFPIAFTSGDVVEVYSYENYNPSNNIQLNTSTWPNQTGYIQLISNGVAETFDLDYTLQKQQLSGFNPSTDVLSYDMISSQPVVVIFSGLYEDLVAEGLNFNPIPNFSQIMSPYMASTIILTGISGVCANNQNYPNFGFDIYLNGQKLVSGYQYSVGPTGTSGFAVTFSGSEILNLYTQLIFNTSGSGYYLNQMTDLSDSEMTFVPQYGGLEYQLIQMGSTTNYISGVSGFSESVWINGMRQVRNVDYFIQTPCMSVSGGYNPPNLTFPLYNNDIDLFVSASERLTDNDSVRIIDNGNIRTIQ